MTGDRHTPMDPLQADGLRRSALEHLWLYGQQPAEMAERGEPTLMVGGQGSTVWDSEGTEYLDAMSGLWLKNIGYGRREVAEATYEQMLRLSYHPSGTTTEPAVRLAERLARMTPGDLSRCFLVNSGSEAVETALKLARAYHKRRGNLMKYKFIARKGSFHGGTLAATALGGATFAGRQDYEPLPTGFLHAPQPEDYWTEPGVSPADAARWAADAVEEMILFEGPDTVAAVVAEPISSAANLAVPGPEYWPLLRQICDRHDVLLIADEVITGFGRTGRMFGVEHWDVTPDIMTVAKGITSGYLPMGAAIARKHVADVFVGSEEVSFRHIVTFGGHPVCAAAALANLDILEGEGLVSNAVAMGTRLLGHFQQLQDRHPIVGRVRGLGLMLGILIVKDRESREQFPKEAGLGKLMTAKFRERLVLCRAGAVIQIMPPLCVTAEECDRLAEVVDDVLTETERELKA